MKIYQISFRGPDGSVVAGEHRGYFYASSKRDIARIKRENTNVDNQVDDIRVYNVEISKRGILAALNRHGGHPDNG